MLLGQAAPSNFVPKPNRLESFSQSRGSRLFFFGYASSSSSSCDGKSTLVRGIERVPAITNNDSSLNSAKKSSGSFGRLKSHKVKALVHITSRMKQERNSDGDNLVVDNAPFESFVKKKTQDTEQDLDQSESTVSLGSYSRPGYQNKSNRSQNSDAKIASSAVSVARRSSSRLRGWDSGGSFQTHKSESQKFLKEQRRPLADSNFFSRKSFRDLGYSDYMIESLAKQSFLRPSHIQAMAFTPVIGGKTCVIADQSGSGKTLAYLAPIIQRLRQEELEGHSKSSSQAPRVIILAPTAELASQVLDNCRSMSKSGVPFKSMVVTGGFRQKTQLESLQQGVDVLIATPGRFLFLIKEGFLQLTNLRCAVLDEVDILFGDEDFKVALQLLMNSSPVATQYLFVTATLPTDVYNKLVENFPDCEMIMGPSMHRISPRLEEVLIDCSGEDGQEKSPDTAFLNKKSALLRLAEENPVPRTIVFCNKIETCRKVENALKRFDRKGTRIQVLPFHAALTQELRLAGMEEFKRSPSKAVSQFMVCTDRASRGIDFAGVDHVVLFDFPRDPSEYVRRVGRTARGARGHGKAFIFVVGKQVSLARRIMERNLKGHPLHDVPSA